MATSVLTQSILDTVKRGIGGIDVYYTVFDNEIIDDINTAFMYLHQMGVGPQDEPFYIEDRTSTWNDFDSKISLILAVKQYVIKKVKLEFDPPTSAAVKEAIKSEIDEAEWRLCNR